MTDSSAPLIRLSELIVGIRTSFLRSDQGYGIGRTALVRRWTIKTPGIRAKMIINSIPIVLDGMNGKDFDSAQIRSALREIIPMTDEENQLCRIDSTLYGTQLMATEHYRYAPAKQLFDFIFTGDLCVVFALESESGDRIPDKVEIEEEYALSEIQIVSRVARGESVDQIRVNCREQIPTEL